MLGCVLVVSFMSASALLPASAGRQDPSTNILKMYPAKWFGGRCRLASEVECEAAERLECYRKPTGIRCCQCTAEEEPSLQKRSRAEGGAELRRLGSLLMADAEWRLSRVLRFA